jgi:hypothetical protein
MVRSRPKELPEPRRAGVSIRQNEVVGSRTLGGA